MNTAAPDTTFECRVEQMTLAEICRTHTPPDVTPDIHFLKIDVEGAERAVLAGADFATFRPSIVLVEATKPTSQEQNHETWEPLLFAADYRFAYFDGLNRFYIAAERFDTLKRHFELPPNVFDNFIRPAETESAHRVAAIQLAAAHQINEAQRQAAHQLAEAQREAARQLAEAQQEAARQLSEAKQTATAAISKNLAEAQHQATAQITQARAEVQQQSNRAIAQEHARAEARHAAHPAPAPIAHGLDLNLGRSLWHRRIQPRAPQRGHGA